MAITHSTLAFVGTNESSGTAVANNVTVNGAEVDVLGDDASVGELELYAVVTSTVAVGTIDIKINKRRVSGQSYKTTGPFLQITPINGMQLIPLGRISAERYMQVDVLNNATGASATVAVLGSLFKGS